MDVNAADFEIWPLKIFLTTSSTDVFYNSRYIFNCNFYTQDLQKSIRSWIKDNNFLIDDFSDDNFVSSIDSVLKRASADASSVNALREWLRRGTYPKDNDRKSSITRWVTLMLTLASNKALLKSLGEEMLGPIHRFDRLVVAPRRTTAEFFTLQKREWDPYATGDQKRYNTEQKTEWDRKIYVECCLDFEYSLEDGLATASNLNFFNNFIDRFFLEYDDAMKERFCSEAIDTICKSDVAATTPLPSLFLSQLQLPDTI